MATESTANAMGILIAVLVTLLLLVSFLGASRPLVYLGLIIMNIPNVLIGKMLSLIPNWLR